MLEKIVRFSINNPLIIFALTGLMAVWGWISFQTLSIDAVPDITNTQVQIITNVDGLVPADIERRVTFPLESSVNGILGVTQIRSITRLGISHITVIFDEQTDFYRARQLVSEKLTTVTHDLPPGIRPQLGPISTGLGEIYHYHVTAKPGKKFKSEMERMMELRALQDWFIKPRLMRVKGVTEVNTIGGFEKQYHIQPNLQKMNYYGIHFEDLSDAVTKNNYNVGGGYVQQSSQSFLIQAEGLLKSIDDIENIPLKVSKNLRNLKIKDVAHVALDTELRNGASLVNGEEAVLGTIMMLMGENSRTIASRVHEEIQKIKQSLPEGYDIVTLYNRSEMVNETLGTVIHNLLHGSALVILFLILLVGNMRAALITALTIPLSLLFTFIIMKSKGVSGNLMSLGALDFGIIIDSAVIVIDSCIRHLAEKRHELKRTLTRDEVKTFVGDATTGILRAALFGQIIIITVFVPILSLNGVEGKMFIPMALTFIFALVGALILSFTTVPALAGLLLQGDMDEKSPPLMRWMERMFVPLFDKSLKTMRPILISTAVLLAISLFIFTTIGGEFIPTLDEGSLALDVVRPMSISIDKSIELQRLTEKLIMETPEVDNVFSRLGTSAVPADPSGVNLGDTYVTFKPKEQWRKGYNKEKIVKEMTTKLDTELLGQQFMVTQPIQMRFNELLQGTRADVTIKIFGDNFEILEKLSLEIMNAVKDLPGIGQLQYQSQGSSPLLQVKTEKHEVHQIGFGNSYILDPIGHAFKGEEVGYIFNGIQRFPIVVRLSHEDRDNLSNVKNLPIGFFDGLFLPLDQVADIKFVDTYHSIFRESGNRRSAVLINLSGIDVENFVLMAKKVVDKKIKLPPGHFIEWGGNYENLQHAKARLMLVVPITLMVILLILFTAFGSWGQCFLIFSCVPMALIGGIFALKIAGMPFSISSGVGFIALSGIAVLNGVVLVSFFNQLKLTGLTGEELVKKGTMMMLRPVLMTALVDAFGFLPMLLSTGLGAEVQKPLAAVVIGGIISATLLTLIVLPILFKIFEKRIGR